MRTDKEMTRSTGRGEGYKKRKQRGKRQVGRHRAEGRKQGRTPQGEETCREEPNTKGKERKREGNKERKVKMTRQEKET